MTGTKRGNFGVLLLCMAILLSGYFTALVVVPDHVTDVILQLVGAWFVGIGMAKIARKAAGY